MSPIFFSARTNKRHHHLLAEVNGLRAANERELLRTQKQLGRLQTRLETALAAERDAASALASSISAAAGKDIFDTKH